MGRGSGWTDAETVALCRAWVKASLEAPHYGKSTRVANSSAFWARIYQLWCQEITRDPDNPMGKADAEKRPSGSLLARWNSVRPEVEAFCGILTAVTTTRRLEWTDAQCFQEAMQKWIAGPGQGKPFKFLAAWRYLRDQEPWQKHLKVSRLSLTSMQEDRSVSSGDNESNGDSDKLVAAVVDSDGAISKVSWKKARKMETLQSIANQQLTGTKRLRAFTAAVLADEKTEDNDVIGELLKLTRRKVDALETQNKLLEKEYALKVFTMMPDTMEAKEFFAMQQRQIIRCLRREEEEEQQGQRQQ